MNGRNAQLINPDVASDDLSCPITLDLFFAPVVAMPCGHLFEQSKTINAATCPTCRIDVVGFAQAPPIIKNMLENVLSKNPKLYAEVYFNLDDFAQLIASNELETELGRKYIKLLQHAANHLNDKAVEGQHRNKNAVEILATSVSGCALLNHDHEIRALISETTLQIKIHGKTIRQWFHIEAKKPLVAKPSVAHAANSSGLFANNNQQLPVDCDVWEFIVQGNKAETIRVIDAYPNILKRTGTAVDYSERYFATMTPLQAALCAGDIDLCALMTTKARQFFPAYGKNLMQAQFNELFPRGYARHLLDQENSVFDFAAIKTAITQALPNELTAVLTGQFDASPLCQAIFTFRAAFTTLALSEQIFNPYHLLKALEIYKLAAKKEWNKNPQQCDIFWRMVIGYVERYLPACYAQAFCHGLHQIVQDKQLMHRSFNYPNSAMNQMTVFYPLDVNANNRLGYTFALYSAYSGLTLDGCSRVNPEMVNLFISYFRKFIAKNKSDVKYLMLNDIELNEKPGCVIQ